MKHRWARLVAGLALAALVLLSLEGIARLATGRPSPLVVAAMPDGTTSLFEQRGETLVTGYQGIYTEPPIPIEPPADAPRVVWLGGSSMRGGSPMVPLSQETAAVASRLVGASAVNLGGPGLDTGHIAGMLDTVLQLRPAAVVLYTGHNDLGNAVFHNRYADGRTIWVARVRGVLGRSRLFQLSENALRGRETFTIPTPGSERRYVLDAPRRRVVVQRFEERLRIIVRTLVDAGIPVVVSTVASNPTVPSIEWSCREALEEVGYRGFPGEAEPVGWLDRQVVAAAQERHPDCWDLAWLAARIDADQGERQAGMAELDRLRDTDPLPLRADRDTVALIARVAQDEGGILVDANAAFRALGGGLEPPVYFEDFVHFTAEGHDALGRVIAPTLARALGRELAEPEIAPVEPIHFADCGSARCRRR